MRRNKKNIYALSSIALCFLCVLSTALLWYSGTVAGGEMGFILITALIVVPAVSTISTLLWRKGKLNESVLMIVLIAMGTVDSIICHCAMLHPITALLSAIAVLLIANSMDAKRK